MIADKRDERFAYLALGNHKTVSKGLYPSHDYLQVQAINSARTLIDIAGSNTSPYQIKVIMQDGATVRFSNLGSNTESNDPIGASTVRAVTFGSDGVYVASRADNTIYRVNHLNTNTSSIGTYTGSDPDIGAYDGEFYWWITQRGHIMRQIPGSSTITEVFTNTRLDVQFVDFFQDFMVLFSQEGNDVVAALWDKSDSTNYEKIIKVKNSILIAGGVVDGTMMLVYSVGNTSNPKEMEGEMVIAGYDGEKFTRLNSIKAGRPNATRPRVNYENNTRSCGSEVMLFAVDENDRPTKNPDLFQNYIYKVRKDGSVVAETLPVPNGGDSNNFASHVKVFPSFNLYAMLGTVDTGPKIRSNQNTNNSYSNYSNYTTTSYITDFLTNPFNYHRLKAISCSFEKLFKNPDGTDGPEEMEVYCRTSEREPFALIGTITAQKVIDDVNTRVDYTTRNTEVPVFEQRYQFTEIEGGNPLPEFNEIQFKFVPKNGFSMIGAWFEYEYITRNVLK